MKDNEKLMILLITFIIIFMWSVINPHDYLTWFLEVVPVAIGLVIILIMYRQGFRFSLLAYFFLWVLSIILMIGGHYTYGRVPAFDWIRDVLELARNHYDRLGHFAQGFFPAIIIREILIRKSVIKNKKWMNFIIVSIALAISAFYELIEWWVASLGGVEATDSFLGAQGDVWDTQWDMFLAFIGAIISLFLLCKLHDKSLKKFLQGSTKPEKISKFFKRKNK